MRRIKRPLLELTNSKDLQQTVYHFLLKHIGEVDLIDYDFKSLFSLLEEDVLDGLVKEIFLPFHQVEEEEGSLPVIQKERIHSRFGTIKIRKTKHLPSFESVANENYTLSELDSDASAFCRLAPNGSSIIGAYLLEAISLKNQNFSLENTHLYRKIANTLRELGLAEKNIPFLLFASCLVLVPSLDDFMGGMTRDLSHVFIQKMTDHNISDIIRMGATNSNYVNFGILEENGRRSESIALSTRFREFILDDSAECFGLNLVKQDNDVCQPLSSFFLPEGEKNKILNLLKSTKPVKILLHGTPGTGKTQFARSVIREAGLGIHKVDSEDPDYQNERKAALVLGDKVAADPSQCLIFDEADDLLNEDRQSFIKSIFGGNQGVAERKIWMNDFLDGSKGRVIFITNESDNIHESVLRRFDYNIEFMPSEFKQRRYYWNRVLEIEGKSSEFCESEIDELAEKFPVGVGGISTGVQAAKKILSVTPASDFKPILHDVVSKHVQLIGEKIKKPTLSKSPYDRSILNVDASLEGLEHLVAEYKESLYSAESFGGGSLCLLFYGKPGTGKTEYTRYLAKKYEMELIQKRSSDLQNPFLGMTEKNIAQAFQEAERKKAIFFLDEADSFFRSRELASRSWEGSQTNEFLTWMESFQGIFIASTNFLTDFDQAALRRFAWKGEFKPLDRDAKIRILNAYFPSVFPKFTHLELENIKDIPGLTPGDYKAVLNQFRFRDPNLLTTIEIEIALRKEASFKSENAKKIVGF